ncbi:hypothetical protein BH10PSE3_BH10PSE3_14190 [soil metagenome]
MRTAFVTGLALVLTLGAIEQGARAAQPAPTAPVAADLDLRGDYAHGRCHGPDQRGEGLTVGVPGREAQAIAATQGRVKRSGGLLTVGKTRLKTKMVNGDSDDEAEYEYLGRFARSGVEVVFVMRYEDMAWQLIDPRSGQSIDVSGPPLASPDGKAIAAIGDDSLINEFNGIDIVDYQGGQFDSQAVEADYPCDPVWLDANTLQVKVLSPRYRDKNGDLLAGELPASAWKTTRVIRRGGVWTLVPVKP